MVAEPHIWVDVESAVRAWARDEVASGFDRRVFFGFNNHAGLPQIVMFRIGGRDDACLIQFDAWAEAKSQAADIAADLCTAADQLSRYVFEGVLLHGARVDDVRWQPDEESDTPRYIVDVTFTATAGQAHFS